MLEILLTLKIKDINLDRDKEQEIKEKKLLAHKQNVLQLSKKEKKVSRSIIMILIPCLMFFISSVKKDCSS